MLTAYFAVDPRRQLPFTRRTRAYALRLGCGGADLTNRQSGKHLQVPYRADSLQLADGEFEAERRAGGERGSTIESRRRARMARGRWQRERNGGAGLAHSSCVRIGALTCPNAPNGPDTRRRVEGRPAVRILALPTARLSLAGFAGDLKMRVAEGKYLPWTWGMRLVSQTRL